MKKTILLFLGLCLFLLSLAQDRQIKGKVVDEFGSPLSGVNVVIKGSSTGVQTDANGDFTITTTSTGRVNLEISSAGFQAQTVSTDGNNLATVTLQKSVATLDDVVVVGYATQRRRDITSSVSSVSGRQLKDNPLSSAAEAMQGRLAGVQVVQSEGAPGADIIVRVRGGGSITQDNSPLYIVDGVQVDNALSVIAPQDIASIDVLKDAASTAIYGARGANGVVIITTRSGRNGRTQVNYTGSFGWRELQKTMDVLSPYDFVVWQYERSRGNVADSSSFVQTYGTTWDTLNVYKKYPPINWQKEVFGRRAGYQNHNVSVNGGNANTSINLSLTANREDGVQLESGFDRTIANFKLDQKASEKLKIGFTARYIDQKIRGAGTTNSGTRATNRFRHAINYRPFELATPKGGIDDFDEAYYLASSGATNPILLTRAEYQATQTRATYLSGLCKL